MIIRNENNVYSRKMRIHKMMNCRVDYHGNYRKIVGVQKCMENEKYWIVDEGKDVSRNGDNHVDYIGK